jgi:hypothetical protein
MDALVFVREPNSTDYDKLGSKEFSSLPRLDEFISAEVDGKKKYFQIVAIHHVTEKKGAVEIYAVHTDPPWQAKRTRTIGFGS